MNDVVAVRGLTKRFGKVTAVDDATFGVREHTITGLLGRNGAGKTTIMSLLTGQEFPTSGSIEVFGQWPAENAAVLSRVCFIKESQKYPDEFRPVDVFKSAPLFFEHWDQEFATRLIEEFRVPLKRRIKKLSRGQLSAVGVIVGLASRAPLTFFDEPYLGLDAVARQKFYDLLLADYAEHPRTVILSTHLIDEVSNLLEHVIVIDEGRVIVDQDAESLRGSATTVVGMASAVDAFVAGRDILHRDRLGGLASVSVAGLTPGERKQAVAAGLELAPVSLQQLVVRLTESNENEFRDDTVLDNTAKESA
jgi:ABC-2 type transport system ATP-binding protein